jgi:hypothetical protein
MSQLKGIANITKPSNSSSSSEESRKLSLHQQWNQKTVFLDLQFLLSLLKYTDLWNYCQTCPLLFNKYKKYIIYKLNRKYSRLYYTDETVRAMILENIPYPKQQIHLDLSHCNFIRNVSDVANVYSLKLCYCDNLIDVSNLGDVKNVDLSYCYNIINVYPLRYAHSLNLTSCPNITDFSSLGMVCYLNLSNCAIRNVHGLENVHDLNLSYCRSLIDVRPLANVNTLTLRGSFGVVGLSGLTNVRCLIKPIG